MKNSIYRLAKRFLKNRMVWGGLGVILVLQGCQNDPPATTAENVWSIPPAFAEMSDRTLKEMLDLVRNKYYLDTNTDLFESLYSENRTAVRACANAVELQNALEHVLEKFGHSHITVLAPDDPGKLLRLQILADGGIPPPEANPDSDVILPVPRELPKAPPGDIGIRAGVANGRIYVIRVSPGSPADHEGVNVGDRISGIGNRISDAMFSQKSILSKPQMPWAALAQMSLSGASGTVCTVRLLDSQNIQRELNIPRVPNGLEWTKLGVMPPDVGQFEAAMLDSQTGYLTFSPCMPAQIFKARRSIGQLKKQGMKGLIIDLRGNPGGLGTMSQAVCGMLIDTPIVLMREISRHQHKNEYAYPQQDAFLGPVAMLIDGNSASSSEILAAGLKDNHRARLFGTTTAGQCLGSNFFELSSGFRLQTVLSDIERINGRKIEGIGVEPDIKAVLLSKCLKAGYDNCLEAARSYLQDEIRKKGE